MKKSPTGDAAILVDPHPLYPHVTLRTAGDDDPACACGREARFVVVEVDIAAKPPHIHDFTSRMCLEWRHMLLGACLEHLAQVIDEAIGALEEA